MLLQLFLYFSVKIETENYKLIYESRFIKWGKICSVFGTFYDQLWASTPKVHKIFLVIFDFSLLDRRVVKNRARDF